MVQLSNLRWEQFQVKHGIKEITLSIYKERQPRNIHIFLAAYLIIDTELSMVDEFSFTDSCFQVPN